MSFTLGILGAVGIFAVPISAWVAFASFRDGDSGMGWKATAVACVSGILVLAVATPYPPKLKTDCRVDWDGRTNPTVCD